MPGTQQDFYEGLVGMNPQNSKNKQRGHVTPEACRH